MQRHPLRSWSLRTLAAAHMHALITTHQESSGAASQEWVEYISDLCPKTQRMHAGVAAQVSQQQFTFPVFFACAACMGVVFRQNSQNGPKDRACSPRAADPAAPSCGVADHAAAANSVLAPASGCSWEVPRPALQRCPCGKMLRPPLRHNSGRNPMSSMTCQCSCMKTTAPSCLPSQS